MEVIWRRLETADFGAADGLVQAAGWNQTAGDWADYLLREPEGCLAAEIGGGLAGTAIALPYGTAFGWIGMVLVHPDHRRAGLGTELLRRSIAYLQRRGTRCIRLDATAVGKKVYLPMGFRDQCEVARFDGVTPSFGGRLTADSGVAPLGPVPAGELQELDCEAFGAARPGVLADLGRRDPSLCFALRDGPGLRGYLIARQGRSAIQLGPWVAKDPDSAGRLLRSFCRAASGRRVFCDVPLANSAARTLIAVLNPAIQRSFSRMWLGDPPPPEEPNWVYGTAGPEKG